MTQTPVDRGGLTAAIAAFSLWGFFPAYFYLLRDSTAAEILVHRILWTVPSMAVVITVMKGWGGAAQIFRERNTLLLLTASGLAIGVNWYVFTWALINQKVVSASIGYYINPLMNIALGMFLFREQLSRFQYVAIGLAALGVLNQIVVVGEPPYIALTLALSFCFYGYIKRLVKAPPVAGLMIEGIMLAPFGLFLYLWIGELDAATFLTTPSATLLLMLLGVLTATPLVLFSVSARRIPFSVLGVIQYIAPSMHLVLGILLGEPFSIGKAVTFLIIWTALAILSWDLWRRSSAPAPA